MQRSIIATLAVLAFAGTLASCNTTTTTTEALTVPPTTLPQPKTRLEVIEARLEQLNVDRLAAIFDLDPIPLADIHANQTFYDSDLATIVNRAMRLNARPNADTIEYRVIEVLLDRADCVVASTSIDLTSVFNTSETEEQIEVMWQDGDEPLLFAAILPANAPDSAWLEVCDETPRGVTP